MLLSLLLAHASASSTYPGAVEAELEMPCAPTCTLCHESNIGGVDTVTRAFGVAMMDEGLTGGSATSTLLTALAALEAGAIDSDDDGTIDVEELAAGADPNPDAAPFCEVDSGGEVTVTTEVPLYGCFGGEAGAGAGLVALIGLASLRRRPRA